jgi:hypothetical protein
MATPTRTHRLLLSGLLVAAASSGCTDAGLQPPRPEGPRSGDDLLRIRADYCAQPDEDAEFPVKVLFLFDQSNSLQCTDAGERRFAALREQIDRLRGSPSVLVGGIGFSSWTDVIPFGDSRLLERLASPARGLGPATDYEGVLTQAARVIEEDIRAGDPRVLPRTRYVVVLVTDGEPAPQCRAGCEDDAANCGNGEDDDDDTLVDGADPDCMGVGDARLRPDNLYAICNTDQEERREALGDDSDEYVALGGTCPAYNQPEGILRRVDDLIGLADAHPIGGITVNSVLIHAPDAVVKARGCIGMAFGYSRAVAHSLLQSIAVRGNGTFRDVDITVADDGFLRFDYTSLRARNALTGVVAHNEHARIVPDGLAPDRDTDGLPDALEVELELDAEDGDTDGDLYGDLFEHRLADLGFDPADPDLPAVACAGEPDSDGDRLRDCEEDYVGTSPDLADSDGDRLLDFLELLHGTDPTVDDGLADLDSDRVRNGDEVRGQTDPVEPDEERYRNERVRFVVTDLGRRDVLTGGDVEERQCYRVEVDGIRLIVNPEPGLDHGLNRVMLYATEELAELGGAPPEAYAACFEAFYLGGATKYPEDGVIDVTEESWLRLLGDVQNELDGLAASCPWFDPGGFAVDALRGVVDRCYGDGLQIGAFWFEQVELDLLVDKYLADVPGDLPALDPTALPLPASALFRHVTALDRDLHCYRPYEVERLVSLFRALGEACAACGAGRPEDAGVTAACCGGGP